MTAVIGDGPAVEVRAVSSPGDYTRFGALVLEYLASLDFLASEFQDLDAELADLAVAYGPPGGAALLAVAGDETVGIAAVRGLDDEICELKRTYVVPAHRRAGLGRELTVSAIAAARALGYRRIRLDTAERLAEALALYESLGFHDIAAYRPNPLPDARFLELEL